MTSSNGDPDPLDPDLDRPCTSCRADFHRACLGCGLLDDDPRTQISNGRGGP